MPELFLKKLLLKIQKETFKIIVENTEKTNKFMAENTEKAHARGDLVTDKLLGFLDKYLSNKS